MITNGTLVSCKNGHVVCEVVDETKLSVPNLWGDAFGRWRDRDQPPKLGMPMPVCGICGADIVWPKPE